MNLTIHEASLYVHKLANEVKNHRNVEVVLAAGYLALPSLSLQIDHRQFKLAAQDLFWRDEGAFTGEVSAHQLRGLVQYAIIGHSERRHLFKEHDKDIRAKVQAAVRNGITPVLCVGETAHERAVNETAGVIHDQVTGGLANLTAEEVANVVIAYEPVWAIGTGTPALPKDVERAVKLVRRQVEHLYGKEVSESIRVIYGASVSSHNASDFLTLPGVDGLLPGSSSLSTIEFSGIIEAAFEASKK